MQSSGRAGGPNDDGEHDSIGSGYTDADFNADAIVDVAEIEYGADISYADSPDSADSAEYADEEDILPPINPDIKWYVIHTYSGYENKVKANIEKVIENRSMQEVILDIVVPMEEQIEIKDGRKKVTLRKVFPGYVLIKMLMTDETWYVVRNTRGVTGFVGPGSRPVPLSEEEVKAMGVEEFLPVVD